MLTALLNGGVGEIAAVATRYYGGVKLGKGGLSRAYSGGVVAALNTLPTRQLVPRIESTVSVQHAAVPGARRIFERLGVEVIGEDWSQSVTYRLSVPRDAEAGLASELAQLTRGGVTLRTVGGESNT